MGLTSPLILFFFLRVFVFEHAFDIFDECHGVVVSESADAVLGGLVLPHGQLDPVGGLCLFAEQCQVINYRICNHYGSPAIMYEVVMVKSVITCYVPRSYGRTVYAVRVFVSDPAGNWGLLTAQSS